MHTNFYIAIAALIPILVLAISLQSSFFLRRVTFVSPQDNVVRNLYAMVVATMLIMLILSEGLTLYALYHDISRPDWALALSITTATSALFIVVDFILALFNRSKDVGIYLCFIFMLLFQVVIWIV